jgi:enamine deaminase RidA (YjgF/YER057c/UK114 family)
MRISSANSTNVHDDPKSLCLRAAPKPAKPDRPIPIRSICMTSAIDSRLTALGVTLPTPAAPAANYVPFVVSHGMLYISGQIPVGPNGLEYIGKLGQDLGIEEGRAAARLCAINILAQAKAALGDLDRVARIVKLTGFVNGTAEFGDQPKVVNGASDFIVEVFGDKGRHARSAVGVAGLPFGVGVEIEAVIEIA